jgi:hypothetical protein
MLHAIISGEIQLTVINYWYDRNVELFLVFREVSHVHVSLRNLAY